MSDYKILQRLHVHGGVRFHILQDHESKPFDTWDSLGVNISWPPDTAKVGMDRDSSWNLWTRSWQRSCGKCRPYIVKQNMLRHEVLIFVRPHPNSDGFLGHPDAIFVFQKLHQLLGTRFLTIKPFTNVRTSSCLDFFGRKKMKKLMMYLGFGLYYISFSWTLRWLCKDFTSKWWDWKVHPALFTTIGPLSQTWYLRIHFSCGFFEECKVLTLLSWCPCDIPFRPWGVLVIC